MLIDLQSASQQASQSFSRSFNQSVSQPFSRSVFQSVRQPAIQSVSLSVGPSASHSVGQSFSRSVSQPVSRSTIQSVSHSLTQLFVRQWYFNYSITFFHNNASLVFVNLVSAFNVFLADKKSNFYFCAGFTPMIRLIRRTVLENSSAEK